MTLLLLENMLSYEQMQYKEATMYMVRLFIHKISHNSISNWQMVELLQVKSKCLIMGQQTIKGRVLVMQSLVSNHLGEEAHKDSMMNLSSVCVLALVF